MSTVCQYISMSIHVFAQSKKTGKMPIKNRYECLSFFHKKMTKILYRYNVVTFPVPNMEYKIVRIGRAPNEVKYLHIYMVTYLWCCWKVRSIRGRDMYCSTELAMVTLSEQGRAHQAASIQPTSISTGSNAAHHTSPFCFFGNATRVSGTHVQRQHPNKTDQLAV